MPACASLLTKEINALKLWINCGLIGSILIGNNAVNVLGSALATSFAIALFGEGGLVWATIGMTVLLVVFAEVMPKTY